ncbi:hypothetical protein C0Q70_03268 [Pomacea canaliculata]|uniref:Uncharacterized protein n=1 Tax=Pomacea canaliculata TaxID=400727 RepID=A0A2T7PSB9_POMCA|nr:hypothetical protein C0Q70_03268 [Pomacea canaliculata]
MTAARKPASFLSSIDTSHKREATTCVHCIDLIDVHPASGGATKDAPLRRPEGATEARSLTLSDVGPRHAGRLNEAWRKYGNRSGPGKVCTPHCASH